jgi:hypothetical protein
MAVYTIGLPDGRKLKIEAGDEATAIRGAEEWLAGQGKSQATAPEPPSNAVPGSREYADWAAQRAREQVAGGQAPNLPQVSADPNAPQMQYNTALERVRQGQFPDMTDAQWQDYSQSALAPYTPTQQGTYGGTLGYGDEAAALAPALGSAARSMVTGQGPGFGQTFEDVRQLEEARLNLGREQNGMLGGALETVGALGAIGPGNALMSAPMQAAPLTARELGKTALASGSTGAVLGGVQGFGSTSGDVGERLQGAVPGAVAGGIIGTAAPLAAEAIGRGVSSIANRITGANQTRLTNQAIQGAPSAADLKATASSLFQQVDNSGVAIDPQFFGGEVMKMANKAGRELIDRELDAPAWRMYQIMAERTKAAFEQGRGLSLGEIHNLRQIAQDVSMSNSGRTARFANEVIDQLDNLMANIKPAQMVGGATGADKGRVLLEGVSTWSRARKVGLIEEALYKAQNQASGLENGLRIQFRQLLQNPKTRRLFSQAERDAIERVVQGTTGANMLKLIGKFGFGSGNASNMLGGSIGSTFGAAVGSPLGPVGSAAGAAIAGGGATLARRGSEALTNQAANRAAQVIATPNIPQALPTLPPERLMDLLSGAGRYGGPLAVSASN